MVDISIHHIKSIEIGKHILGSGVWVCNVKIFSEATIDEIESITEITLFSENMFSFNGLIKNK